MSGVRFVTVAVVEPSVEAADVHLKSKSGSQCLQERKPHYDRFHPSAGSKSMADSVAYGCQSQRLRRYL